VVGWRATTTTDGPSWLMSVDASSGQLVADTNGAWVLELQGVDSHVTAFTDRPDRITRVTPLVEVVDAWETLFDTSAPNGVLTEHNPDGARHVVVELGPPETDGDTIRHSITILDVTDGTRGGLQPPTQFGPATLFIDDTDLGGLTSSGQCGSCWG